MGDVMNIKQAITTIAFAAITFTVAFASIPSAFADHEDEEISNYIWSRASSDGHRSLLSCEDSPNADRCDIPYDIASNIANIAGSLSATQIGNEASNAESNINGFNVYIDAKEATSSVNDVTPANLGTGSTAEFDLTLHCTFWLIWCWSEDMHIVDFDIEINTHSHFDFATSETCSGTPPLPSKWDLEKVFNHELYHMFGVDHDASNASITAYNGYICNEGMTPTAHDKEVVNDKYVSGVT